MLSAAPPHEEMLAALGYESAGSTSARLHPDHLSLTRAPGSKLWGIPPDARLQANFHHERGR
jgi:hypothetical protein